VITRSGVDLGLVNRLTGPLLENSTSGCSLVPVTEEPDREDRSPVAKNRVNRVAPSALCVV
jgi:hypothetical protein